MDIGSILLILALLVLVALFVTRPLLEKESQHGPVEGGLADHQLSALLAERDQILNALHELDLDYALGKIPEEDYPLERGAMLDKGARVLRQLDQLTGSSTAREGLPARSSPVASSRESRLQEAAVGEAAVVGVNGGPALPSANRKAMLAPDDELEMMLATRRRIRQEKAAGFCPSCGHAVQKTDHFCPKCGQKIG